MENDRNRIPDYVLSKEKLRDSPCVPISRIRILEVRQELKNVLAFSYRPPGDDGCRIGAPAKHVGRRYSVVKYRKEGGGLPPDTYKLFARERQHEQWRLVAGIMPNGSSGYHVHIVDEEHFVLDTT